MMKALITVHPTGNYFVAADLLSNVTGQGPTEEIAVQNLRKDLEKHYQILIGMTPGSHKLTCIDIDVDNRSLAPASIPKNSS
jgi:hypothetical protein